MSHKGVEYSPTGHIKSFRQSFLKEKCQKGYDTPVVMISSNCGVTKQTLKNDLAGFMFTVTTFNSEVLFNKL